MHTEDVIEAADVVDGRPPGDDRKAQIIRSVFLFLMPFLMVTMMFATYMSTMHSPHPRDMPVAVVGSGAEAQAIVDDLNAAPGDTTQATSSPPATRQSTCCGTRRSPERCWCPPPVATAPPSLPPRRPAPPRA